MASAELTLPGRHNIQNVLVALAIGLELELPLSRLVEAAKAYRGAAPIDVSSWLSEMAFSLSMTVRALMLAQPSPRFNGLSSDSKIWLILGGQGKGQDFSLLSKTVSDRCAGGDRHW